jgi:hypothetical protein
VDAGSRKENASTQKIGGVSILSEPKLRSKKSPEEFSGTFSVSVSRRHRQVRVRMRIMKLSKLNSATCIHASDSLR